MARPNCEYPEECGLCEVCGDADKISAECIQADLSAHREALRELYEASDRNQSWERQVQALANARRLLGEGERSAATQCLRCGNAPCQGCNPCCGYSTKPLRNEDDNSCNGCG